MKIPFLCFILFFLCQPFFFAHASLMDDEAIKKTLEEEKTHLARKQAELVRLTEKERLFHADLAQVEDALEELREAIKKQDLILEGMSTEIGQTKKAYDQMQAKQKEAFSLLYTLVKGLWPVRLEQLRGDSLRKAGWEERDRNFTWRAVLYDRTTLVLKDIKERFGRMEENMGQQKVLWKKAQKKLQEINKEKDVLLVKRLQFVGELRKVRARRVSEEQALAGVMASIEDLDYRLNHAHQSVHEPFPQKKGSLSQPVQGKLSKGSASRSRLLQRGVIFATTGQAPVKSVFSGKVVYNDILRGFGQVIILFHGDDYYSLYAFLAESKVGIGQKVSKGEVLGNTGFFPAIKSDGLYFELRFGQKAIDPTVWFAQS